MSAVLAVVAGVVAAAAVGAPNAPPPGATAVCRDATYSFSQTHSGTCSHHGGVAAWLAGGATTAAAAGRTVLLAPRTRTAHCRLGANPDRRCSPGARYANLTQAAICAAGFRTSAIRNVPESEKFAVEREYGLAAAHYGRTLEIDHIVSLELGGSNDIANLFPERADARPGYGVKDRLENRLHTMVCAGAITLVAAQRGIASNWQTLYLSVFGDRPVG